MVPLVPCLPVLLAASASDAESRMRMMGHADSLYSMAHVLTLDAAEAAALVEAVYRRAGDEDPPPAGKEKEWLLRLMREEAGSTEGRVRPRPAATGDFRRKLALRAVQRVMPAAFASLDVADREILMLVHVERFDSEHVAAITGDAPDDVAPRLENAENAFRNGIYRSLFSSEVALLQQLPEGWLREAINDMVANDLPAMPPTVRTELIPERVETRVEPRREQPSKRPRPRGAPRLQRMGVALLIIFFTGLFAYGAARILERPPETNALLLSADAASSMHLDLVSDDARELETFVQEQLNWRLTVPVIEGTALMGVQIREIGEGIRVPAIFYEDEQGEGPITVVAYTYALLDRAGDRLQFEPATLSQIQDPGHYDLHDLGRQQLLVWRHRNNIFVAVTRGQAETLQDRVYPAS